MNVSKNDQAQSGSSIPPEVQQQLKMVFDQLPNTVPLYLFTKDGSNDVYNHASKEVIRSFAELGSKIELHELSLDHELAKKYRVDTSPTVLFDPEHYSIRFLGAPMGEEGRTLLETVVLIGLRKSNLSEQSLKIIEKLNSARKVKIFSSPTCPYCPQQAVNAIKAAIAKPELISLEIVDIQANPPLADLYSA